MLRMAVRYLERLSSKAPRRRQKNSTWVKIKKCKKVEVKKVTLDQNGCEYHPHVMAFPAGSTVEILNPDGILHNVHSYSKVNSPFNQAQPKFKKTMEVKIEKPEAIEVKWASTASMYV